MNIGKPLRIVEREVKPRPAIVVPTPKPEEKPIYVPDWPVRKPEPAVLPGVGR